MGFLTAYSTGGVDHLTVLLSCRKVQAKPCFVASSLCMTFGGFRFEYNVLTRPAGGLILKGSSVEEVQTLLDDHTIKSQAMLSSPAAAPFLERIESWVKKLAGMQDIIDAWMLAQQKWMFLGPVYGSEEIAKQMPKVRSSCCCGHRQNTKLRPRLRLSAASALPRSFLPHSVRMVSERLNLPSVLPHYRTCRSASSSRRRTRASAA